jgi:phage shock protein A
MTKGKLRINQRDGYVSEAYAEASSKVENLKRITNQMMKDRPDLYFRLADLHRKSRKYREQARTRLLAFEEVNDELAVPELLSKSQLAELVEERARLVGEIFIRLYQIDLTSTAARRALGT